MAKSKTLYVCNQCGYEAAKWLGKCPMCGQWNTFEETTPAAPVKAVSGARVGTGAKPQPLAEIPMDDQNRVDTGMGELDRVLGGGLVPGSLVLLGGDPGIGKSTLLLQVAAHMADHGLKVLYLSGEESPRQIKMRARRLGVDASSMLVVTETDIAQVCELTEASGIDLLIVDSIQTVHAPQSSSAPGSVSQVREATSALMRLAKTSGCAVFLVGHVTKEGAIAGPRVLEHMVDTVLYFEGDRNLAYRILRAVKNRFGSTNEIGVFQMHEDGMMQVTNPSELLLSEHALDAPGSAVFAAVEGSRTMLVEIQALMAASAFAAPRRVASGLDYSRVVMLMAVLEKRVGLRLSNQDGYLNVAGGLTLEEPAADLAMVAAVASSYKNAALPPRTAIFGEVGLTGEVRAVGQAAQRLAECAKLGFTAAVLPKANCRGLKKPEGMTLYGVEHIGEALQILIG